MNVWTIRIDDPNFYLEKAVNIASLDEHSSYMQVGMDRFLNFRAGNVGEENHIAIHQGKWLVPYLQDVTKRDNFRYTPVIKVI